MDKELNDKNYHCRTLNNNINNKRILIYINYKKSYDIFSNTLKYFSEYSEIFINKIKEDFNYKLITVNVTEDVEENKHDIFVKDESKTSVSI